MNASNAWLPDSYYMKAVCYKNTQEQSVDEIHKSSLLCLVGSKYTTAVCCVFQPACGCCSHPKAGRNIFSGVFQPFLLISELFQ